MDDAELSSILQKLREAGGFFELYRVMGFHGARDNKQGKTQDVSITILDAGPGQGERYLVMAQSDDDRVASGHPESTVEDAIGSVHWHELDAEEHKGEQR